MTKYAKAPASIQTINEGKEYLARHRDSGAQCPCCSQLVRVYKRKLHAEMCGYLYGLYTLCAKIDRHYTTQEIIQASGHLNRMGVTSNGTLLQHWGLIEKIDISNNAGAPAGSYRITPTGVMFMEDKLKVPCCVLLLNGIAYGHIDDNLVGVRECMKDSFNYDELMKGED